MRERDMSLKSIGRTHDFFADVKMLLAVTGGQRFFSP